MKKVLSVFLLIVLMFHLGRIEASYKTDIYKAYITSDLKLWKRILDEMEGQRDKSNGFVLELLNYQYGYIAWNVGNHKIDNAEEYLKLAEKNIKILENCGYQLSSVISYKAALYGFRIVINKIQAPFIAPKSIGCARKAVKLDVNNPFAYIQLGNTEYFMPSFFGGSKPRAIEYYLKALRLMERKPEELKENWNYLNLLTLIAIGYQELNLYRTSKVYFDKILNIEPDYKWVKEDLYPKLLRKLK